MNIEELEYESDSDDVGEDMDMDRIPENANTEDSDEVIFYFICNYDFVYDVSILTEILNFQELRVALATGLIQPGSKVNLVERGPKHTVNNVEALKQKLSVLRNNLPWTERLDLTIDMVRIKICR